jgi:hypothetical protein
MIHHLNLEVEGRLLLLKLPEYLPPEMVLDLADYLGVTLGGYPVAEGHTIKVLAGNLEMVGPDLNEAELLSFVDRLYHQVNCWFYCYPSRLAALAREKAEPRLRVLPGGAHG